MWLVRLSRAAGAANTEGDIMKITYYGHSCFGALVSGRNLLFDPFISGNELASGIRLDAIPADFILISHGHADHLADAGAIARRTGATIVSNYEITQWFGKQGLGRSHPLNHGGAFKFEFGRVKFVNAIHSSGLPDGTYGGNPGGFVVESAEGSFYYSGDTALTMDMKLIGESFRLDFACLPIGDNFTMGVEDAIRAAQFVNCKRVLGLHYDTFPPIKIDREEAVAKFKSADVGLVLLKPGEAANF
jgi:L-ascorbate metabolism protein UlaG (beta-lactamase superfamily)